MTHHQLSSVGSGNCVEDEDYQTFFVPRAPTSNNHSMLAYSYPSSHDQHSLPLLQDNSFSPAFTQEPNYTSLNYGGALIPMDYQQLAYHPQHDFTGTNSSLPYLHGSRSSIQLDSFGGTMEPQMMFRHQDNLTPAEPSDLNPSFAMSFSDCSPDILSGTTASPHLSFSSSNEQYYPASAWQHNLPSFQLPEVEGSIVSMSDGFEDEDEDEDEDEGLYDKPYAQLIYDALMEAPGHRMLLRDIYDWFLQNTRKPRESGTNGWQNSIRHNLSMNQVWVYGPAEAVLLTWGQAFENDKNDPASSRGARKANSVWVLTEHATKHGVQSTTRYRKTGTSKKAVSNRIPAIQRQRSGAKGGRAARRAARLKRQGESQRRARTVPLESETPTSFSFCRSPLSTAQDQWSSYSCSPTTPAEDHFFSTTYNLPPRSYYEYNQEIEPKQETEALPYGDEHLSQMLSQSVSEDAFVDKARL